MADDQVIGKIMESLSEESRKNAAKAVLSAEHESVGIEVPFIIQDELTRRYIKELGLKNPQKMAEFLIEVGFSAVNVTISSINDIKKDLVNEQLSKLKGIKRNMKYGMAEDNASEQLKEYRKELVDLGVIFEDKVVGNIQAINRIDKMSSFERRIKAAFIRDNVDTYTKIAKVCLQAVMEIARLQIFVANYTGNQCLENVLKDTDEFMEEKVFCNDNISMMNEWSTEEDRDFWSDKLRDKYKQIRNQQGELLELFKDMRNVAEEQQVDLENIVFK